MKPLLPLILLTSICACVLQAEDQFLQRFESQPVLFARLERPSEKKISQGELAKVATPPDQSAQPTPVRYGLAAATEPRVCRDRLMSEPSSQFFQHRTDRLQTCDRRMSFKKLLTGSVRDFKRSSLGIAEMNTAEFAPSRLDPRYEPPLCVMLFLRREM